MTYNAQVLIYPKKGVLDTQGKAVAASLRRSGHAELVEAKIGRYVQLYIEASDAACAMEKAQAMCEELLVNDLIEEYQIKIEDAIKA